MLLISFFPSIISLLHFKYISYTMWRTKTTIPTYNINILHCVGGQNCNTPLNKLILHSCMAKLAICTYNYDNILHFHG